MEAVDGRTKQRFNELSVLEIISNCGWVKARHIGLCVWPESNPDNALRMAQITLKGLKSKGQVLDRIGPDQSTIYALSGPGARTLQRATGLPAKSGKDSIKYTSNFPHRNLINELVARLIGRGLEAWSEHAVRGWRSPIKGFDWQAGLGLLDRRKNKSKYPDAIVLLSDDHDLGYQDDVKKFLNVAWVEVERGRKGSLDYHFMVTSMLRMVAPLNKHGAPTGEEVTIENQRIPVRISECWLVCPDEIHVKKFVRKVVALAGEMPWTYSWQYAVDRVRVVSPEGDFEYLRDLLKRKGLSIENS